jgi:RimJ/RimL family protein N-acetyltransferase
MNVRLRSDRLMLWPAGETELLGDLRSAEGLSAAAAMEVAHDWPPLYWDAGAIRWLLRNLQREPDEPFWRAWYVALRGDRGGPPLLVGTVGVKGPPDTAGMVEVGYGVVSSCWRRGIASEALGLLMGWAVQTGRVRRFRAHTLMGDPASGGVLRRCGFEMVGRVVEGEDGEVDRWERVAATR